MHERKLEDKRCLRHSDSPIVKAVEEKLKAIVYKCHDGGKSIDSWEFEIDVTDDPIVNTVIEKLISRSAQGMKTYGVPMTRTDLSTLDWINHAQEEALDFACYLERLKKDIQEQEFDKFTNYGI